MMEIVFISGWAVSETIWNSIKGITHPVRFIEWNDLLAGNASLPSECILAGWSLGGQLALELSSLPQVKGLVLISSMCCLAASENRPGIEPVTCTAIKNMLCRSRQGYLKAFFTRCGARDEQLSRLQEQSDAFSDRELQEGLDVMFSRLVKPDSSVPAVVIHGTEDGIIPFDCSRYLVSDVLNNSVLVSVDNGCHLLPFTHPHVIEKAVEELARSIHP